MKKEVFSIRKIEVVAYDETWSDKYFEEKNKLQTLLKTELIRSFHIGSTAVPGLKAKPIIDLLLIVNDLNVLDAFSEEFEALGYEVMGEYGIKDRRFFQKGKETRTHHVHAFQYNNINEIERHLLYRDYLRSHPVECERYALLKSSLAEKYPDDIAKYFKGKESLVKEIEQSALQWHWASRK